MISILKWVMVVGILLFLLGHYIISYSGLPETMGVKGIYLGAFCMAVGLAMSLPTKMYLTFLFVTRENRAIAKGKTNNQ
ncbi:hypothetical protein [Alteromonas sp. D210916BOD_24]|uniref:hypothetical protein n=1 Tax=Alteromonas sp. D210916BOD_24 TaxID=3157618 RepID=UPI00399CE0EE